ncbi:MAG: hypothetical protein ACOX1F_05915 [Erysipelotrichaceae bacterium]|jgi:hypothetical protein
MKKSKSNSPIRIFIRFFLLGFVAVFVFVGILLNKGYRVTVGKLYFRENETYLINENNVAMIVFDGSLGGNLFDGYSNGDEVFVVHGVIRETYPMTTDGIYAIRLKKGDGNYKPDEDITGLDKLETDIVFEVQYIRTDGYHEDVKYPLVKIIRSAEELNKYYQENKDKYNLNDKSDSSMGFLNVIDKYDEDYFKNQALIIILLEENSGSNRHSVKNITSEDGMLVINIERTVPEIGTCDMAQWHILIEIKSDIGVISESDIAVVLETD